MGTLLFLKLKSWHACGLDGREEIPISTPLRCVWAPSLQISKNVSSGSLHRTRKAAGVLTSGWWGWCGVMER